MQDAQDIGFDFIVSPLNVSDLDSTRGGVKSLTDGSWEPPMLPERVMYTMVSGQVSNHVVGAVSEGIDPDSPLDALASAQRMSIEIAWASHLTCQACMLPFPKHSQNPGYAQCINAALNDPMSSLSLWMQVPIKYHSDRDDGDPWNVWNNVRFQCSHHVKLGVALEIDGMSTPRDLERWLGEPIKAIIVNHDVFTRNQRGVLALQEDVADVLVMAYRYGIQIVLDARTLWGSGPFKEISNKIKIYWEYMSYLFRKQLPMSEDDILEIPYRDFLQAPLQPLQDNLESQTYETFERDSPKYKAYEDAIFEALKNSSTSEERVVVMVVGAGRGPLVAATLQAAMRASRDVKVYAVEKNRNAVVHLYARHDREKWHDRVTIVHADMRQWSPEFKADILVSELLGSFGDNELSPECLDGAQKFLKMNGVSIPSSYTSYLCPITATKAWSEVSIRGDNPLEHFETPFVVLLHAHRVIDASKRVFTFSHPHWCSAGNKRFATMDFVNPETFEVTCHGFAGYFEAVLYGDVTLSIRPETHTEDMHSWFPIFFPLRDPITVPAGAPISVSMWRRHSSSKVWYEWAVSQPSPSHIHNPNGRSYYVGL